MARAVYEGHLSHKIALRLAPFAEGRLFDVVSGREVALWGWASFTFPDLRVGVTKVYGDSPAEFFFEFGGGDSSHSLDDGGLSVCDMANDPDCQDSLGVACLFEGYAGVRYESAFSYFCFSGMIFLIAQLLIWLILLR